MQNFSSTSQINFLEIEVSEEIDIKNLKKFISTSLSLNNKHLTSKDRIYLNYIKELKQYQIFILGKEYKYFDFQVFEQFFDKKDEYNEYNLYICNNFFTLYKNGICYYFQNIDGNIKNNEFLEYINKRFFLEIKSIKDYAKNNGLKTIAIGGSLPWCDEFAVLTKNIKVRRGEPEEEYHTEKVL